MSRNRRKKDRQRREPDKPVHKAGSQGREAPRRRILLERMPWRAWMIVLCVALLAHSGALMATFYFDDMRLLLPFTEGDFSSYWWSLRWSISSFRVVTMWSLWLNYQLTGLSSIGFHAVNIAMHAGVAILAFFMARDWLSRGYETSSRDGNSVIRQSAISHSFIALAAASMFAAHPLASEITHYVRARDTLLMTGFGLAAAWAFSCFPRRGVMALNIGILLAITSIYSKPTGPAWIACLMPWTVICFWNLQDWKRLFSYRKFCGIWLAACVVLLTVFWQQVELGVQRGDEMAKTLFGSPALSRMCLTQLRLSQQVATQLVAPIDLVSDHQGYYSLRWNDPGVLVSATGILASMMVCVWLWRKKYRWQSWAVGTIIGTHLLHCPYVLGEYYCEYRVYPSVFCFSLLVAAGLAAVLSDRQHADQRFLTISLLVVSAYCFGTWTRSITWTSVDRLARDVLDTYPLNVRAHYHVIMAMNERGDHKGVVQQRESMNLAMAEIQAFNREKPHGRMRDWPLAIKFATVAEGMSARSTIATQDLDAGLAQIRRLEQNLERQGLLAEEEYMLGLSASKLWAYSDAGHYKAIPQVTLAPQANHPTWYQRAVKEVEAKAKEAGQPIPWPATTTIEPTN